MFSTISAITLAISLHIIPTQSLSDRDTFELCKTSMSGYIETVNCYTDYIDALKKSLTTYVDSVNVDLSQPSPPSTVYATAKLHLSVAQTSWRTFVEKDCAVLGQTFGEGSAFVLAQLDCVIRHYEQRIESIGTSTSLIAPLD